MVTKMLACETPSTPSDALSDLCLQLRPRLPKTAFPTASLKGRSPILNLQGRCLARSQILAHLPAVEVVSTRGQMLHEHQKVNRHLRP